VSWLVASFAIVLGALLAGWLAYERSRPSARMTAIVATLAAVAALGRDAFVALPDVKPITAIALVVGYALGPLPGFTVGAVGMLASNVMLGQGSYTPWQMAAWGLVGLIGAGLGGLARRGGGRSPIASLAGRRLAMALVCALSAMLAKEIMNVYTWTLSGSHTLAAFLAAAGAALPFDVTDAVASFAFAFAFGPELARLLGRVRSRMNVSWESAHPATAPAHPVTAPAHPVTAPAHPVTAPAHPVTAPAHPVTAPAHPVTAPVVLVLLAAIALTPSLPARAAGASAGNEAARGVDYLRRAQNADGGFGAAPGQRSSELFSAWAAIGLAAAGQDPLALRHGGPTVLDSIRAEASTLQGAGDLERTILALRACGASAHTLPGGDLAARLLRYRSPDGSFGRLVNLTAFAILALRATGEPANTPAVSGAARWLAHQQNQDGGFGYAARGTASDIDDTGAALEAVVAASVPDGPVVSGAVGYLAGAQNGDGGYPQERGRASNAQSTAWAVQGLLAAGRDPGAIRRGRSPLDYLQGLLTSDGSVRYSAESAQTPVWVTGEALAALAGRALPVAPVASTASRVQPAHKAAMSGGRRAAASVRATAPGASRLRLTQVNALARDAGVALAITLSPALK
jgi:energy-coupling factor transport system substrate-specific component